MLAQEASRVAGGILADEMGLGRIEGTKRRVKVSVIELIPGLALSWLIFLGKTVQILTLVCLQKQIALSNLRVRGRPLTLIVVQNVSLMEQWAKEIRKCFRPNFLSSVLYHGIYRMLEIEEVQFVCCRFGRSFIGTSRAKTVSALDAYDVVITTFGTLAADSKANRLESIYYFFQIDCIFNLTS